MGTPPKPPGNRTASAAGGAAASPAATTPATTTKRKKVAAVGMLRNRWSSAAAVAVGAVAASTAAAKWPSALTVWEKPEVANSGIDLRWPISLAVLGYGWWKGYSKLNPLITASAFGIGLSWALDRATGMITPAAPAAPTAEGIYIGQIEDDSGAIGLARRLNRTEGALNGLRRGAVEDRLQARLERRQAAGKPLTGAQRRFLAQEHREDAAQARISRPAPVFAAPRFGGGGGAGQPMVRVPISAVKPAFLANMA